jgi:hypothetical protein
MASATMQFRCVPVVVQTEDASDRFMRLNTGRLGPASAARSGSAKRFRATSSCWIEREPAFFLASSGFWIPPTK